MKTSAILTAALALAASPASADIFSAMGRDFSRAAQGAGIERVAVLPFLPMDGADPAEGLRLSEKVLAGLVRAGRVQVLERRYIEQLLSEQRLSRTGAVDRASLKRMGRLLPAGGLVLGSYTPRGSRMEVRARLIDLETGVILAASERDADRTAEATRELLLALDINPLPAPAPARRAESADPSAVSHRAMDILLAAAEGAAPGGTDSSGGLRDAPAPDAGCRDAARRAGRLERSVLELKARYWAGRLRAGAGMEDVERTERLASADPALGLDLRARIEAHLASPRLPKLDPAEVHRIMSADSEARRIRGTCPR